MKAVKPVWLELSLVPLCVDAKVAKQFSPFSVSQHHRPTLEFRFYRQRQVKWVQFLWNDHNILTSYWVLEIHSKFLAHRHAGNSRRGLHVNLKQRIVKKNYVKEAHFWKVVPKFMFYRGERCREGGISSLTEMLWRLWRGVTTPAAPVWKSTWQPRSPGWLPIQDLKCQYFILVLTCFSLLTLSIFLIQ